jgi:hypothetical protein
LNRIQQENFDTIHDEVDKWVDQIIDEVFDDSKEPTVMELSKLFSETKQKFFGACFQALMEKKYVGLLEQEYAPCLQCGKVCKKRRQHKRDGDHARRKRFETALVLLCGLFLWVFAIGQGA